MIYRLLTSRHGLGTHLLLGFIGTICLGFAFHFLPIHLGVGLIFMVLALAAFRGCPTCWLATLFSMRSSCPLPPADKPSSPRGGRWPIEHGGSVEHEPKCQ